MVEKPQIALKPAEADTSVKRKEVKRYEQRKNKLINVINIEVGVKKQSVDKK